MPIPDFVVALRRHVGHAELWLPAVTAVVTRPAPGAGGEDVEVLLVRRSDTGAWTPVTGILDPGEEPAVGAVREVAEETGVRARADRLASTGVMAGVRHVNGDLASYLDLTFACTWLEGEPYPADDESTQARFWPRDDLPEMSPVMRERVAVALEPGPAARFAT